MAKFIIQGGKVLRGEVVTPGNKNAALPMLAATLLTTQDCVLKNMPKIGDVLVMGEILRKLGAKIEGMGSDRWLVNTRNVKGEELDPLLVSKLRASILLLGPMVARFGWAKMRHPGGCMIGRRAVGTHFDALEALGVETITGDFSYESKIKNLKANCIFLDEASPTATENALMVASLIPEETIIEDAACEPHVADLARMLAGMGAKIQGAGSNLIRVVGRRNLTGVEAQVGPDFMDVAAMAIAAAVTQGKVTIKRIRQEDLMMISLYFNRLGLRHEITKDEMKILPSKLTASKEKIQTRPWPGFPTDVMSPFIVLATQAEGLTLCHDWMYESRMFFVDKLIAMGANITLCDPHRILVSGPTKLRGKVVESPDIRAGMALICAALCAEGESVINNAEMIERGYEDVESRLRGLGAEIKRVE
ncbi:MAG: UDP-N-acetylglucosamine 1-carboxyvinyltransferase [Candidatus Shapirobacteria bacterium]